MNKKIGFFILGLLILTAAISGFVYIKAPNFVMAKYYYWRGFSKHKLEDRQGAIIEYSKILAYDNEFTTAYINRGSLQVDLKKYSKAIADYNKAIELEEFNTQAYAYRGRAYYEMKQYDKAMLDYNKAIALDDKFAYTYYNRALLFYTIYYDFQKGCQDLNKANDLDYEAAGDLLKDSYCD